MSSRDDAARRTRAYEHSNAARAHIGGQVEADIVGIEFRHGSEVTVFIWRRRPSSYNVTVPFHCGTREAPWYPLSSTA